MGCRILVGVVSTASLPWPNRSISFVFCVLLGIVCRLHGFIAVAESKLESSSRHTTRGTGWSPRLHCRGRIEANRTASRTRCTAGQGLHGFIAVAESKRRQSSGLHCRYGRLHGFIAVAESKLHGDPKEATPELRLHGFIAVAESKLRR